MAQESNSSMTPVLVYKNQNAPDSLTPKRTEAHDFQSVKTDLQAINLEDEKLKLRRVEAHDWKTEEQLDSDLKAVGQLETKGVNLKKVEAHEWETEKSVPSDLQSVGQLESKGVNLKKSEAYDFE
jgi:hypothetical protein